MLKTKKQESEKHRELVHLRRETGKTYMEFKSTLSNLHEKKEFETYESTSDPGMSEKDRKFLKDYFEPHNQRLYKFLGRDFGW